MKGINFPIRWKDTGKHWIKYMDKRSNNMEITYLIAINIIAKSWVKPERRARKNGLWLGCLGLLPLASSWPDMNHFLLSPCWWCNTRSWLIFRYFYCLLYEMLMFGFTSGKCSLMLFWAYFCWCRTNYLSLVTLFYLLVLLGI